MTATATIVPMPRLSDSMEEGTIAAWLVADGELVAIGQPIIEIETDKATMTYEAEDAGPLFRLAADGDTVTVGAPLARIGEGDDVGEDAAPEPTPAEPTPAVPASAATAAVPGRDTPRVAASPVARRIAEEHGVDLATVAGSGPRGRVVKADVLAAAAAAPAPTAVARVTPVPVATPTPTVEEGDRRIDLSRIQQTIAQRMVQTKTSVPEFVVAVEVDMSAAVTLRAELKQRWTDRPTPSYNDMVVRAVALALRAHPRVNATYGGDHVVERGGVHVGIAVAAEGTLVVPVVRDADELSLSGISRRSRELAGKVREGTIAAAEMEGGTFTVSNLGMLGVDDFEAVINGTQVGILAVGAVVARPIVRDREIVVADTMRITLTSDHRVIYGADAAAFVSTVREHLETPMNLLS